MIQAIISGIGVGILIALPTGPVGFLIIRRMLIYGVRAGMYSAFGSVTSDLFYSIVVGFSLTRISNFFLSFQRPLQLVAGVAIAYMGWKALRKSRGDVIPADKEFVPWRDYWGTFLINMASPQILVTFSFIFSAVGVGRHTYLNEHLPAYLVALIAGSLLWWYGVAIWIDRMRSQGKDVSDESIRVASAWVLLISGSFLLITGMLRIVVGHPLVNL